MKHPVPWMSAGDDKRADQSSMFFDFLGKWYLLLFLRKIVCPPPPEIFFPLFLEIPKVKSKIAISEKEERGLERKRCSVLRHQRWRYCQRARRCGRLFGHLQLGSA